MKLLKRNLKKIVRIFLFKFLSACPNCGSEWISKSTYLNMTAIHNLINFVILWAVWL